MIKLFVVLGAVACLPSMLSDETGPMRTVVAFAGYVLWVGIALALVDAIAYATARAGK